MKTKPSLTETTCPTKMAGHLGTACATLLLLLLLLLMLPAVVQAQYTYTTNHSTIAITGYTGPGGAVTIPSTINGLPVTRIADYAFSSLTSLTIVMIGTNVIRIGDGAFSYCASLTAITVDALNSAYSSVDGVLFDKNQATLIQYPAGKAGSYTIPNSVTFIGRFAFSECYSLTGVTIPNSVTTIGDWTFINCWSLTSIMIGDSVTSIGELTFAGCGSLISVTIPDSVTNLGYGAFQSCSSLTSATIGNSVTSIGSAAFAGCSSLASVSIPSSVNNIGYRSFSECTSLTAITVDALNSAYSSVDGVLFNKSQTTLIQFPAPKAGSYAIPNSVTNIGDGAFGSCWSLTSVTIPNSVTSIGGDAFAGCTSLTSITIPNSVTSIGIYAFSSCTSLTGVYFKGNNPGLSSLGSFVFDNSNQATVYYLPMTTGWNSTIGGRPAKPWNPQALTSTANFGVHANRFGFTIIGTSDLVIVVEACTNLANSVWTPVGTNTLTGGLSYFSDPQWTNYPARLYRLRSP